MGQAGIEPAHTLRAMGLQTHSAQSLCLLSFLPRICPTGISPELPRKEVPLLRAVGFATKEEV